MVADEGKIFRKDGKVYVQVIGDIGLQDLPNVTCPNPRALKTERIYQREFVNKPIFLPNEYNKATNEYLKGNDVIVLGMNGYSSLTPEKCLEYGVKIGAYEAACASILRNVIRRLETEFRGVDIRLVHGSSDMGVDSVIMKVATQLNRPQLGHSCPKFMFYVNDDEVPVYVSKTQAGYADSFVRSLDILIAANGRKQAFEHDISAAFNMRKHLIPINVLKSISNTGGPPAENAKGEIEDAVALMEQRVHMISQNLNSVSKDPFSELNRRMEDTVVSISRLLLSPSRAYGS